MSTPQATPSRSHSIAVLPGDGVGPEVTQAALTVLDAAQRRFGFGTDRTDVPLGADHYAETGELLTEEMVGRLREHDAILFGAIGSPSVTPGILERGVILALRREMRQAINLRPVRLYPGVPTPIAGLTPERCDLVIVRENTEGAYVAQGSTVHAGTPAQVAVQESVNTWYAVERAVDFAYRLASVRRRRLTLCHKTNVLVEAGKLWTAVMDSVGQRYPEVETDYVHVDAMCMHLPVSPERFDVVVTDNLFGDIVTDLGAVLQGGLGVAASGNLNLDGSAPSMFEPIHGSAPDIAGKGWANPAGACLSLAMMLGHLGEGEAAAAVEAATGAVLAGLPALAGEQMGASTQELGERIAVLVADGTATAVDNSLMSQLARVMGPTGATDEHRLSSRLDDRDAASAPGVLS
ncbi:3-isopropylmalate dehydrogenase [Ornithinimicrobium pekingense]|uniref:3-isopropylmalate dehydrogenase n=1 Tax=Ornithinimicrobium pekingense TaxID=384677 RepID=A0ABQ2FER7_9MICO|nr:3-isopropylmalate dehydrogenase [Ornithinimicrobium pekingense]GGK80640.1 3-isopropylmalate dehydrogenase [Ornithinimicrobium pekingense]